jgi:hypothetical protein
VNAAVWPHGDPRDVVRAIVADPRFHGTTSSLPPGPTLPERIMAWLAARLGDVMHAIGHVLGARTPLNVAIGFIVLALTAAVVVVLAVRFVRLPARPLRSSNTGVAFEGTVTSAELVAQALTAARNERWHDAASALARAALHALDERGRLRFDPARTPGEARRLLHDAAFDAFEREATTALFAEHAATPERFARLRATYADAFGEPA